MIDLEYSLIIEATDEPNYFGFYSPDLVPLPNPDSKIIVQNEEKEANIKAA